MWQASCILRNFELRTGHTVSWKELDSGKLSGEFIDSDYDFDKSVSIFSYSSYLSARQFDSCLYFTVLILIPALLI